MAIEREAVFCMTVTPFKENGEVDEQALRRVLLHQAAAGVGIYLLSFASGEGHLVNHREMLRIYEIGSEELRGRTTIYAAGQGLGPSTGEFIKTAQEIASTGVDGIQVHAPRPGYPWAAATPTEVERYFQDVLEAVRAPCVLSVHPGAVPGVEPRIEFLKSLVETYPHLIGFNVTHPSITYVMRLIDAVGQRVSVRVGGTWQALPLLALGGHGFLCFEANVAPRLCAAVAAEYRSGAAARAGERWATVTHLFSVLDRHRNPASIKAAMRILGLPGGFVRRPYLEVGAAGMAEIAETLDRLEIRRAEGLS